MFNHLRGNWLIIYLSNVGDREHIKDTQSIIHRFCTNPLKPRTTFGAGQDDEHEGFCGVPIGSLPMVVGIDFEVSDVKTLQISFCQGK